MRGSWTIELEREFQFLRTFEPQFRAYAEDPAARARLDRELAPEKWQAHRDRFLHLRFAHIESEAMVVLLDQVGIAASAGAACSSGAVEPSHVLAAMGLGRGDASSGVRFSLGVTTTDHDVARALARIPDVVGRLRN